MNNLEKILPYLSVAKGDKGFYRVVYDGYKSQYNKNGDINFSDIPGFFNRFSFDLINDENIISNFGFIYNVAISSISFPYDSSELMVIDFICKVSN